MYLATSPILFYTIAGMRSKALLVKWLIRQRVQIVCKIQRCCEVGNAPQSREDCSRLCLLGYLLRLSKNICQETSRTDGDELRPSINMQTLSTAILCRAHIMDLNDKTL